MSMDVDQNHESGVEQFGDMIRFLGPLRCTSCQQTDGRCVIGRDEMRCLLCAGASKDCQFKRTITRTLPIRDLTWEEMTNPSSCYEVHVQQTSPDARQRFESHENRSPPPPPPQPRDPYQIRPLLSSRTSHADGSGLNSSNLESPTQSTGTSTAILYYVYRRNLHAFYFHVYNRVYMTKLCYIGKLNLILLMKLCLREKKLLVNLLQAPLSLQLKT